MPEHHGEERRMTLVWRSLADRFRSSLFGVPSLWIAGAAALAVLAGRVDRRADPGDLPLVFTTTVDSARALLGAVASGTIAAASVVFSLTLVAIQLSSNAYSSRVQRTFLRDRFQQHMIGIVVGTFFFALLALREVRDPLDGSPGSAVPSLSVTLAVWLALAALLALLASISHTGRSVRVSWVSASIVAETRRTIEDVLPPPGAAVEPGRVALDAPGVAPSPVRVALGDASGDDGATGAGHRVDAVGDGWVQQLGAEALVAPLEPGSRLRLHVAVGTYVAAGAPLATVHPRPSDPGAVDDAVRGAIRLGRERTLQQDITFGLTLLEDIALRALSPGVNDPNTARAVIPQMGELLVEILGRRLPPGRAVIDGVELTAAAEPGHGDYLEAATGQLRRATEDHPEVRLALARTLVTAGDELRRRGSPEQDSVDALADSLSRLAPSADDDDPAAEAIRELLGGGAAGRR